MKSNIPRAAAVVVAALAVLSSSALGARPWPDTADGVYVFNDQLSSPLSDALLQFSATHYAGTQKMIRSDADALRAYNPNFLILHYRLGIGLGYRTQSGEWLYIIEGNNWVREWPTSVQEQWFYHYNGSRVYQNEWGWYLVAPDNSSWRSYWIGEITRQLQANDDDGLFADSVSVPNYLGAGSFTPRLPDIDPTFEQEWSGKIGRWIAWLKSAFGANYKLIPNAGSWVTTRDQTDYSGADGVMIEGFAGWDESSPFDLFDWQLQMDRILSLVGQGKIVICQAYINEPNNITWRTYLLANYLLIKGTRTFINMELSMEPEWFPEYGVDLGSFVGGIPVQVDSLYRDDWGVYVRQYANGMALVNPSGESCTFDVGTGYRRVAPHGGGWVPTEGDISAWYLSYQPVSVVTLEPYSGAVLVSSGSSPSALSVAPAAGLSSSGPEGGPFSPPSAQYTLSNTGGQPLDWTVTHTPDATWITVSPSSGVLSPGGSAAVTVAINDEANALQAETYEDTVTFTNATNGVGNTARSVELTVYTRTLTSVCVLPETLVCPSADPRQLTATASYSDSTAEDVTATGQWSSSNPTVAVVSRGVVTPKSNGSAVVTCAYTYSGVTMSDTCAVTVSFQTLRRLYISPSSYVFYRSAPVRFTCRALLSRGWLDVTNQCQWSSSNSTVATVDQHGLVTPVSKGTATIVARYTYNRVTRSAQARVRVQRL